MKTEAYRCAMCGAPLPASRGSEIECRFCTSVNVVESDETRLIKAQTANIINAVDDAKVMYQKMQPKMAALENELRKAYEEKNRGEALRLHEALFRLITAPQFHILRAADQSQKWVQHGYREIDQQVSESMAKIRKTIDAWPRTAS